MFFFRQSMPVEKYYLGHLTYDITSPASVKAMQDYLTVSKLLDVIKYLTGETDLAVKQRIKNYYDNVDLRVCFDDIITIDRELFDLADKSRASLKYSPKKYDIQVTDDVVHIDHAPVIVTLTDYPKQRKWDIEGSIFNREGDIRDIDPQVTEVLDNISYFFDSPAAVDRLVASYGYRLGGSLEPLGKEVQRIFSESH